MAIRYTLWLDPDDKVRHRAAEASLEAFFLERFADYPHIRLFGADPYDELPPTQPRFSRMAICRREAKPEAVLDPGAGIDFFNDQVQDQVQQRGGGSRPRRCRPP